MPVSCLVGKTGAGRRFPRIVPTGLLAFALLLGAAPSDAQLEKELGRFHDRLTFVWLDDLSFPEILRRSASLPDNSAIFYVTFGTDAAGAAYADERVFTDLHAAANAPLFGAHSVYLGAGIVGGSLLSIEDLGRRTADVAVRLLNGAAPKSINVPTALPRQHVFDWRALQWWGIPESRLPPGASCAIAPRACGAHTGARC